ncbi:amino acid adenylation domain-containing protein [Paenibacillus sp. sgz500958]|uniref:amino acid adenylation domain-containing protein n=1 Tax=Paenibacillus sp. sgz500958 TaxID=3242475 RepID=UPI0036D264FF
MSIKPEGLDSSKQALLEKMLRGRKARPSIKRHDKTELAPASFQQKQLWILNQLHPGTSAYNIPYIFKIHGRLDAAVLRLSIDEIYRRHDVLRARFEMRDDELYQRVSQAQPVPCHETDLRAMPKGEREVKVQELLMEHAQMPFDLCEGPLLRASLFRLEDSLSIFLLSMHHIVSDGWSDSVLFSELTACIAALSQGNKPELKELPIQYSDYAMWQKEFVSGDQQFERSLAYWKKQLGGDLPVIQLPADRQRPPVQTFRGEEVRFQLDPKLSEGIAEICRRENVSLYMFLLAAFKTLLFRYSGQEDILVGSPVANRNAVETENLIGFFVNTLVMRTDLSGDLNFLELLQRVKHTALEAFANQEVPFEKLVEEIKPQRSLSHSVLFQILFTLQGAQDNKITLDGLEFEQVEVDLKSTKFDLMLGMQEGDSGLTGTFNYSSDLFERGTIERMVDHFKMLIKESISNPMHSVSNLPLLTGEEQHQLLFEWNSTAMDYPRDATVYGLFKDQVARTPDAEAAVFGECSLTYRELDEQVSRCANYLYEAGMRPGTNIGLLVDRSLEMVVALLAIIKNGAAYVPLDPSLPVERIRYIAEDANIDILLTTLKRRKEYTGLAINVVCYEQTMSTGNEILNKEIYNTIRTNEPLYIMYTSGSTGKPKGVVVTHRNVINRLTWMKENYRVTERDCVLQKASVSFDVSVWEMFLPLISGAKLVLSDPEKVQDPDYLIQEICRHGITMIHFIPSLLRLFLEHKDVKACTSLRVVSSGGEALPYELQQLFFEVLDAELHNRYGPTEITINATHWKCDPESPLQVVPIGRPLGNTSVYILDAHRQLVPIGVAGELYIGGDSVAAAYKGQEELTRERFLSNPFKADGSKLYRSGDMVRWLPNGSIEFLGRMDDQVKISGHRIELGEINSVLMGHPDVLSSYVDTLLNKEGTRQLIAYVVWPKSKETLPAELKRYLEKKLPGYMLPTHYVALSELPVLSNGKVDRIALASYKPDESHSLQKVSPRNSLEETLELIFSELLGLSQIYVFDNFFDMGGHSLLAMQAISRICRQLSIDIPFHILFERPTIASIAEYIGMVETSGSRKVEMIEIIDRTEDIPLSFAQQRVWFHNQLDLEGDPYIIPSLYRLTGPLNIQALEQSFDEIIGRHESLRTVFQTIDLEPVQVIMPSIRWAVQIEDRRDGFEKEALFNQIHKDAAQPFDLAAGPLIRVKLYWTGEQEYFLLIVMHHIISDGWSQTVLVQELSAHYQSLLHGSAVLPAPLPVQYADYAVWERKWLQEDVLQQQASYWKQKFAGEVPVLQLPADKPRPAIRSNKGAYYRVELPPHLSDQLRALSREEDATLFMTLLTAFKILLFRYSGQEDIVVGTPINNRPRAETEQLIGFFVNTLALRTDLSNNPSFLQLLSRVRETTLGAFAHPHLPFEKLVEILQVERDVDRTPIFQVMFIMQNNPGQELQLSGLTVENQDMDTGEAEFDLTLIAVETESGLALDFNYNADIFNSPTISAMALHYETLLQGIVSEPTSGIAHLPLLTDSERHKITVTWNDSRREYPVHRTIQQHFEHQAELTPDKLAVEYKNRQMTYRELNQQANQLARVLRNEGVQADSVIGMIARSSLEMIIGVLAIQKAGGALLPFDPATPVERISAVMQDSGAKLLLTYLDAPLEVSFEGKIWDLSDAHLFNGDSANLPLINGPEHLSVLLYTSGTTGKPKGVMIEHRQLVSYINGFIDKFQVTTDDRIVQQATLAFDNSIEEIFVTLLSGASLFIVNKHELLDMQYITGWIQEKGITVLSTTALMVNELNQHLREHQLRLVISGGDVLRSQYITNLKNVQVYNSYGPTEATIASTAYLYTGNEKDIIPIGTPLYNEQFWVLDRYGNLVPAGVIGELYISGSGVTRGYLNNPVLTAEKFVDNPFLPGTKMYKTGDLVRWLADGNLEFIGRADHQVKIRGFRVELGEIEASLLMNRAVSEAIVIDREEPAIGKYLVAYVVLKNDSVQEKDLRDYLSQLLPAYMIPAAFVIMDKIPLNQSYKIDRRALPLPNYIEVKREIVLPRTETEKQIAEIWSQLLGREEIGIGDNFFHLGGHSLLITQVALRMRRALNVDIPVRLFFETPTISELAPKIDTLIRESSPVTVPSLKRIDRTKKTF